MLLIAQRHFEAPICVRVISHDMLSDGAFLIFSIAPLSFFFLRVAEILLSRKIFYAAMLHALRAAFSLFSFLCAGAVPGAIA